MQQHPPVWPTEASYGQIVYPPGGRLGPRFQQTVQLVLIHRGRMTVWIDGQERTASSNSVSLLLPGHEERFAFASDSETHHSWVHLLGGTLPENLLHRLIQLPASLPLSAALLATMQQLLALNSEELATRCEIACGLGLAMLWRYMGEAEARQGLVSVPGHVPEVQRARQFIAEHLTEQLSLAEIAAVAGVSQAHLIRLFRRHLGQTPMAWLWQERVALGVQLLQASGLSVGEIALRCGFQTSYHFSRRIKQATGETPGQLRRRAWGLASDE
ncbi:MAG: AraC family transcriptional regulator [Chloroflexaceae bacterium]|nr:AraC family transcriptional regulator [Chloroflexaceae bacterium]